MLRNYYIDLGLEKNATENEIKKAFRKLALIYHPDKNSSPIATRKFAQINEAYQTLSNASKKQIYDAAYKAQFDIFSNSPPKTYKQQYKKYAQKKDVHVKKKAKLNYSKKSKKIAYYFNLISFIFVLFIFIDVFLPKKKVKIYSFKVERQESLRIIKDEINFPIVNQKFISALRWLDSLEIEKTFVFNIDFKIIGFINPQIRYYQSEWKNVEKLKVSAKPAFGIYQLFMFAPILLILFSALGSFYNKKTNYTVDMAVTVVLLDIYTLFFLLI